MTRATFFLLCTGVLLNTAAQLLLKAGVQPLGAIELHSATLLSTLAKLAVRMPILAGLAVYVVSVVIWIVALSRVDVSIAYPMLSLGYVVNAVAAYWLFGEALGPTRLAGIAVILLGVCIVART